MAGNVHSSSVIDETIKTFDEDFYYALTEQEYECYTASAMRSDGLGDYAPFFQALSDAIVGFFQGLADPEPFRNLMDSIYSFTVLDAQFKSYESLEATIYEDQVFTIAGLRSQMLEYPSLYYDDAYMKLNEETELYELTAPRLEEDTELVTNQAALQAVENAETVTTGLNDAVYAYVQKLMYYTIVPLADTEKVGWTAPSSPYIVQLDNPPAKESMYDLVFAKYGYMEKLPLFGLGNVLPF